MRKRILYLSIVAVLAASCAVREEAGAPDTDAARTILFVADTPSDETRTAFAPGEDGVYPTRWTSADTAVAVSLRRSISASDNEWGAMLFADGQPHFSKTYPIHIVDRVGGGDSFAAGLIYGVTHGFGAHVA